MPLRWSLKTPRPSKATHLHGYGRYARLLSLFQRPRHEWRDILVGHQTSAAVRAVQPRNDENYANDEMLRQNPRRRRPGLRFVAHGPRPDRHRLDDGFLQPHPA